MVLVLHQKLHALASYDLQLAGPILIAAHCASRWTSVPLIYFCTYIQVSWQVPSTCWLQLRQKHYGHTRKQGRGTSLQQLATCELGSDSAGTDPVSHAANACGCGKVATAYQESAAGLLEITTGQLHQAARVLLNLCMSLMCLHPLFSAIYCRMKKTPRRDCTTGLHRVSGC